MGGAGDRAHDDVIEADTHVRLLRPDFFCKTDEPEPAEGMNGRACGNAVGHATTVLHVFHGALPAFADADVEAFVHELDLRAHHAAHENVAYAIVDGVLEGHPALLHEAALQPQLCRNGRNLTRVVGLHAADGHERVRALRKGVGHDVFELANLVAPEGEAAVAVLALGKEVHPSPEMLGQARQGLDRSRAEGKRIAFE